jgi:6-phosphogluconate dehydrogenase
MSSSKQSDIGIVGLGVMGENLALNLQRNRFTVSGYDLDEPKRESFARRTGAVAPRSLQELVAGLGAPRVLLLMVPAGAAVDDVLAGLRPLLAAGDIVIDGGNTNFTDTQRRITELAGSGLLYVGAGVSGGEEGALRGPSIMPGGDAQAWPRVKPLLQAIAARTEDAQPCCDWIGPGASGHFVKMVHNGIEYADMQLICEAYYLMRELPGMQPQEMSAVFADWNRGELASYLVGITADILARIDPESGRPLVDLIVDTAQQKGTGKWASQAALDLGVTAPTIADAVFARTVSALRAERAVASEVLSGPQARFAGDRDAFVEQVRRALLGAALGHHRRALAGRLHHPREAAGRHPQRLCAGPGFVQPAGGCAVRRAAGRLAAGVARRGRDGGAARRGGAGLHERAGLLRQLSRAPAAGQPAAGAARLLRRAQLPAAGPGRQVPHQVDRGLDQKTDSPVLAVNSSSAFIPSSELPLGSSAGDQTHRVRRSGTTATMPPPTPLLHGSPMRKANSPAAS